MPSNMEKIMQKYLFLSMLWLAATSGVSGQVIPLGDTLRSPAFHSWELETARWEKASSYEGRYSIDTPGLLSEKVDTIDTAVGTLIYHTAFFQPTDAYAENVLYMVSYCDYPPGAMHSDSTELLPEFFDATQEEATASMGGELLYTSDISLSSYPGRIWRIDYRNGTATVRTRAYLAGPRYYAVQTISKGKLRLNSSSDRFLDSFRIFAQQAD